MARTPGLDHKSDCAINDATFKELSSRREAFSALVAAEDAALSEWREFAKTVKRKLTAAQRDRSAYLQGQLAGLHQALLEFEMRSPMEFVGSDINSGFEPGTRWESTDHEPNRIPRNRN